MTRAISVRRSLENIRPIDQHVVNQNLTCSCGLRFVNKDSLIRHQQASCEKFRFECVFCRTRFSTQNDFRQHLISCGNKTDQCPVCLKFIRRSHFAYHYENDCAEEIDEEPSSLSAIRPEISKGTPRIANNQNRPIARSDVTFTPSGQRQVIGRSEIRDERAANNSSFSTLERKDLQQSKSTENVPKNVNVYFPCEICEESVNSRDWSSHTANCMEKERNRIKNREADISRAKVIAMIPCESCGESIVGENFKAHQINCARAANPRRENQSNVVIARNSRSNENSARARYQMIDIDRTRAANSLDRRSQEDLTNGDPKSIRIKLGDSNPDINNDPSRNRLRPTSNKKHRSQELISPNRHLKKKKNFFYKLVTCSFINQN